MASRVGQSFLIAIATDQQTQRSKLADIFETYVRAPNFWSS